jgi:hypothetical protein
MVHSQVQASATYPWMSPAIVAELASAPDNSAREAVARRRARLLIAAMTLPQKLQQLTGRSPEILPELPHCFGARHVAGIAALAIPTFRIANGPVGVGQNDGIAKSVYDDVVVGDPSPTAAYVAYTHPTSAQATALPAAISVAASFDSKVAAIFGDVIATEMNENNCPRQATAAFSTTRFSRRAQSMSRIPCGRSSVAFPCKGTRSAKRRPGSALAAPQLPITS